MTLPTLGRFGEAMAIADDALNVARAHANPFWIAQAYTGYGRAFTETEPVRALHTFRLGLAYTRQHRLPRFESFIASGAAVLEAVHGDLDEALTLFTTSIDSFQQAGNTTDLAITFARLARFFNRTGRPEIAATLYGAITHHPIIHVNIVFAVAIDHVRNTLDTITFDHCVATGAAMTTTEAVHYAHSHIEAVRSELAATP